MRTWNAQQTRQCMPVLSAALPTDPSNGSATFGKPEAGHREGLAAMRI